MASVERQRHARPRRSRQRSLTGFIFVGIIGLTLGLTYAWFINPVEYVNVDPSQLGQDQQRTFLILIGLAYASDNNLERAPARLPAMDIDDPAQVVADAADDAVSLGLPEASVRSLANLALALGGEPEAASAFAGPLLAPTVLPTAASVAVPFASATPTIPIPTETPSASATPQETQNVPILTPVALQFVLVDLATFCDAEHVAGLISVQVQDGDGVGLRGMQIQVEWEGGVDGFFTGLKPERNAGYADFTMTEGEVYRVRVVDGNEFLSGASEDIAGNRCISESDGDSQLTAYQLVFRQTN